MWESRLHRQGGVPKNFYWGLFWSSGMTHPSCTNSKNIYQFARLKIRNVKNFYSKKTLISKLHSKPNDQGVRNLEHQPENIWNICLLSNQQLSTTIYSCSYQSRICKYLIRMPHLKECWPFDSSKQPIFTFIVDLK